MAATQDRPRAGGFPEIPYARNVPTRGPSSLALVAMVTGTIVFGYWKLIRGNKRQQRLDWEEKEARLCIFPLLQAEEDRKAVRSEHQRLLAEQQIMSEVKNWNAGEKPFQTPRYVEPVTITTDGGLKWIV